MSDHTDSTPRSIALRGNRSLSAGSNSLISRGLQDLQETDGTTVLHFPRDFSLGWIVSMGLDDHIRSQVPAQGDVTITRRNELEPTLMLDEGVRCHLQSLRRLPSDSLWGLEMCNDFHFNDDLEHIAHLTGLRSLAILGSDELTDEGLQCLQRMVLLTDLALELESNSNGVTNNGFLTLLHCLPRLSSLSLRCPRLTDAFFEGLVDLPMSRKLTSLHFDYSSFSSRGLALIGHLSELRSLSLDEVAGLDDTGLSRILSATQLEDLCVTDCSISDASVGPLSKSLSLRKLVAHGVFSSDAIVNLKKALPQCTIFATPAG